MNAHINAQTNVRSNVFGIAFVALVFLLIVPGVVQASIIGTDDIFAIPKGASGSGNGTLDLRMLTFQGGEVTNTASGFNGDNGNNTLPNSGGSDDHSFIESYVTTAGKFKDFYNLNFSPDGSIDEIVLFLDFNETKPGEPKNTLERLDIILNPTTLDGGLVPLPTNASDLLSGQQAAINQVYTGGTLIANLNPQPAANLPVVSEGAGFADYAIFTGIDPFSLDDDDVLLFNVSMSFLSNGSEEIFASGTFAPGDVPEPATLVLLVLGGIGVVVRRKRK